MCSPRIGADPKTGASTSHRDSLRSQVCPYLIIVLLGLMFFLGACAHIYTAKGAYCRVREGDTLSSIARKYRVDPQDLAEVNNIQNAEELKVGRSIYIPGVTPSNFAGIIGKERKTAKKKERKEAHFARRGKPEKRKEPRKEEGAGTTEASIAPSPEIKTDHNRFHWPIEGEISSLYGMRRGRRHDGIDIRAKRGTPVMAAADGEVVYSKRMRGYGNLILVKHKGDFFTVYAHNSVNLAKVGQKVHAGQIVSKVGSTGRATGPHLHFEVRVGSKARNPLFFLPKTQYAQTARERKIDYGGPEEENP